MHDMGDGHPEAPERLSHLISLAKGDWSQEFGENLRIYEPKVDATFAQLLRVHTLDHVQQITEAFNKVQDGTPVPLDRTGDTCVYPGTPVAALRAAGLVVAAVEKVLDPDSVHNRAFVMARPPGHHAEPDRAMGFCFFNNVLVGAAHAEQMYGIKRIAILDFDVHHGNGDEAMSSDVASRFYGSSHQVPLFPPGKAKEQSDKSNHIINVPLAPGSGSNDFRDAWRDVILPELREFVPEMVFLSAGFDAHADDPMAGLLLGVSDFQWVTNAILEAVHVPVVSVLEGGYDINSLGQSAHAHVEALVKAPFKVAGKRKILPLSRMRKAELIAECKERGLDASGKSVELRKRLSIAREYAKLGEKLKTWRSS